MELRYPYASDPNWARLTPSARVHVERYLRMVGDHGGAVLVRTHDFEGAVTLTSRAAARNASSTPARNLEASATRRPGLAATVSPIRRPSTATTPAAARRSAPARTVPTPADRLRASDASVRSAIARLDADVSRGQAGSYDALQSALRSMPGDVAKRLGLEARIANVRTLDSALRRGVTAPRVERDGVRLVLGAVRPANDAGGVSPEQRAALDRMLADGKPSRAVRNEGAKLVLGARGSK